jgi:glycosyltransferase involved in cell wall biosynthesis
LAESIDSVLAQTHRHLELLISDNASTDRTRDICLDYVAHDPRVRYVRQEKNIGGTQNHNFLFGLSRGKYFCWIGHDDRRAPTFVERCVGHLEADPDLVLCYAGTQYIGASGEPLDYTETVLGTDRLSAPERFAEVIRMDHKVEPIYGVMRSSVLEKTALEGPFADHDRVLTAELSLHGRFHRVDEPLIFRRIHPQSSISVHPTRHERTAWHDPAHPDRLVMPYCRQFFEYLFAVRRAPLGFADASKCYGKMGRWLVRNARAVAYDFDYVGRRVAKRMLGAVGYGRRSTERRREHQLK